MLGRSNNMNRDKNPVLMIFLFLLHCTKFHLPYSALSNLCQGREISCLFVIKTIYVCSVILNDSCSDDGLPRTSLVSNNCKLVMVLLHDAV